MTRTPDYVAARQRSRFGFRVYRRASVFYALDMAATYRKSADWKSFTTTIRSNLRSAREADIAWRAQGGVIP